MIDLLDDIIDEVFRTFITFAMIGLCLPIAIAQDQRNLVRESVKRTYH
jgi:hypothetical protein